jgi:hypothetical protein
MVSSLGWSKLFSMPKCGVAQFPFGFGTAPTRWPLGDAGLLTNDSTRRAGPLYRPVRRVVNRSGLIIEAPDSIPAVRL